jgi:hypothetical protein
MSLIPIIIAMGIDILRLSQTKHNHKNIEKSKTDSVVSKM